MYIYIYICIYIYLYIINIFNNITCIYITFSGPMKEEAEEREEDYKPDTDYKSETKSSMLVILTQYSKFRCLHLLVC